jgi:hypothetical protein
MKVRQRKGAWRVTHWNRPDLKVVAAVLNIQPDIYFCKKYKAYVLTVRKLKHKKILLEWKEELEKI